MLQKTCLIIAAKDLADLRNLVRRHADQFEFLELRLDFLQDFSEDTASSIAQITGQYTDQKIILTLRPLEQGGARPISAEERSRFWSRGFPDAYIDLEPDLADLRPSCRGVIRSFHNFDSESFKMPASFEKDVVKIAAKTNEPYDALPLWSELLTSDQKQVLPIGMGEAGKWTRILGPAYGAPWTYVAPSDAERVAPGQTDADEANMYRFGDITRKTEVYGVIGRPVSHSLSPIMHNAAFRNLDEDAVYIPFDVGNLEVFMNQMVLASKPIDIRGLSVTAPHKTTILEHLDFVDETAAAVGAVNTVHKADGRLVGLNTDVQGFLDPLKNLFSDLKEMNFVILGSGGAARACVYGLVTHGANVTILSRNEETGGQMAEEFGCRSKTISKENELFTDTDVLVNATPVGTNASLNEKPITDVSKYKNLQLAYDLVYNPLETPFLLSAKTCHIPTLGGLAMLVAQGAVQFEIWTGKKAPIELMSRAALAGVRK